MHNIKAGLNLAKKSFSAVLPKLGVTSSGVWRGIDSNRKEGLIVESVQERISYVKGLADGLELFQNKKEGRFYSELLEVITDLNHSVIGINNRLSSLEEYVEAIDEDLNDIEWDYYEEDSEESEGFFMDELADDQEDGATMINGEIDDEVYYQIICPHCNEVVMFNDNLFTQDEDKQVICPKCNELLTIEKTNEQTLTPS